jgi:F-type H+-transporting ATPase subunit gamma
LLEAAGHQLLYAKPLPSLAVPTYVDIEEIALDLLDLCEQRAFGRLLVVHNAPVRRFQYGATVRRLLPPDLAMPERPLRARIVVKPADDMPALLTHLLTEHCLLGLYEAVIASAISEQLARMYTMRLATENARKLLDKLTFDYNLTRSYAVTNSLLEIVAGYTATTEQ